MRNLRRPLVRELQLEMRRSHAPSPRLFLISTFPPSRDGIARYAAQLAAAHEKRGTQVMRVAFPGGHGDLVLPLRGGVRILRLLRLTRRCDSLILMWHPGLYLYGGPLRASFTYLALALVMRARRTEAVIHEPEPELTPCNVPLAWLASVLRSVRHFCWRQAAQISFHSARERDGFLREVGLLLPDRVTIVPHHRAFVPSARMSRSCARRRLGIEAAPHVFLCIGFLGPHKGFDRAINAFRLLGRDDARLFIVGSELDAENKVVAEHIRLLAQLARQAPGIHLIHKYVSDEEFDLWLQAADTLLLPYRLISSSGVLGRARMLNVRAIVMDVGGLREQAGAADVIVDDDTSLLEAMRAALLQDRGDLRESRPL